MAATRLCIFFFFASIASLGQKLEQRVSIDMHEQSVKNILLRLETVADVKFSYTNQVLQVEKKATVKSQQLPLKAILIQLL
jgi:MFS superfamily sulfate permease-like transporter